MAVLFVCCLARPFPARAAGAPRVFLIGVDGAAWRFIDPLLERKRLPHLAGLIRRGCSAVLKTDVMYSPVTWTSIATGKQRGKHGIDSLDPRDGIALSTQRRVKAVWNILSEQGTSVLLSSYMVTQPAERVDGVIVSKEWLDSDGDWADGLYPPDAFGGLSRDRVRKAMRPGMFFVEPDAPSYSLQDEYAYKVMGLHGAMTGDWRAAWTAKYFLSRRRFGFFAVHFWGTDFASHFFIKEASGRVIERYYEYVDGLIGGLLEHADRDTVVIVLSDHGGEESAGRRVRGGGAWIQEGAHHPDGVLIMAGPGVRRCERRGEAGVFDVTPTILSLKGLPAAKDMDGAPLTEFLDPGLIILGAIGSYESRGGAPAPAAATPPQNDIELLRKMGYIK